MRTKEYSVGEPSLALGWQADGLIKSVIYIQGDHRYTPTDVMTDSRRNGKKRANVPCILADRARQIQLMTQ